MARSDELRVGDAERDAVAVALHDHFAAGRLTREELDERLDVALAARTRGDLRGVVRDLPEPHGLPAERWPVARAGHGHPAYHRHPGHHRYPARRGPVPAFPLLMAVFLVVTFTAGAGTAVFAVVQLALLALVLRAVFHLAAGHRGR
ncbi:hypothetical protein GCM10009678_93030 [Actinomadura kijaniata]|uniref:DUF1707 domain-containing protein n=1 Tax=Actinomadura namibiensis TaxID=182080 RepID=A0A7W3QM16_ACTNM|nr:DUF1707 domain-containing protein [Actinomadura namibiensis]MBA8952090.1 hypothetical protein [Actinomadura namibiensis]